MGQEPVKVGTRVVRLPRKLDPGERMMGGRILDCSEA
jgi:hypothetical protein